MCFTVYYWCWCVSRYTTDVGVFHGILLMCGVFHGILLMCVCCTVYCWCRCVSRYTTDVGVFHHILLMWVCFTVYYWCGCVSRYAKHAAFVEWISCKAKTSFPWSGRVSEKKIFFKIGELPRNFDFGHGNLFFSPKQWKVSEFYAFPRVEDELDFVWQILTVKWTLTLSILLNNSVNLPKSLSRSNSEM